MKKTLTNLILASSLLVSTLTNFSCTIPSSFDLEKITRQSQTKPNTALIIIDSQYTFLHDINRYELETESDNQVEVIKFAKKNNFPIYVFEIEGKGKTRKKLREELVNYKPITKPHSSAFNKTNLDKLLKDQEIKNVILMGLNASICVLQSAQDANQKDYKVLISPDIIQDATYLAGKNESLEEYKKVAKLFRTNDDLMEYLSNQ
jgi:nicotinamidase-related amidase